MGPDYPEPEAFMRRFFPKGEVSQAPHFGDAAWTNIVVNDLGQPQNEHGFRADSLTGARGALSLMFVGCSNTAGLGVSYEESFAYLLKRRFEDHYGVPVRNWNLGYAGSSIDFATRTLSNALDVLKPDIVFIVFTGLDRRDYFNERGRFGRYHISLYHAYKNGRKDVLSEQVAEEMSHFYELGNIFDDTVNAYQNYKSAEAALDASGVMWGWCSVWASETKSFFADARARRLVSLERYVGADFDRLEDDRNQMSDSRPGPKSHGRFSNILWDWLHAAYGTRIRKIVEQSCADHVQPSPDGG